MVALRESTSRSNLYSEHCQTPLTRLPVYADDGDGEHGHDEEQRLEIELGLAADVAQLEELGQVVDGDDGGHDHQLEHVGHRQVNDEDVDGLAPQ